MTFTLDESQRQAVLLAIARLAVERPGWDHMLGEIAGALGDGPPGSLFEGSLFEAFKEIHGDGPWPAGPPGRTGPSSLRRRPMARRDRKPTRKSLADALARAANYVAGNRGVDTSHGKVADEILGPILWDYWNLRLLCSEALDAMAEAADGDTPTMARIRAALKGSAPAAGHTPPGRPGPA